MGVKRECRSWEELPYFNGIPIDKIEATMLQTFILSKPLNKVFFFGAGFNTEQSIKQQIFAKTFLGKLYSSVDFFDTHLLGSHEPQELEFFEEVKIRDIRAALGGCYVLSECGRLFGIGNN